VKRLLQARTAPAIALGVVALVVAAAGGAYAASSGGSTISACVHHKGGGLYSARHCARHDKKLSWNTRGPQGAAGKAGAAGPSGASGAAGVTTAWTAAIYPSAATPATDGHVATFAFSSPAAGFVDLTAHFGVRVHNTAGTDCHIQNQIAATPSVPSASPGSNVAGYMDDWINGNLPTQNGAGTYLELDESVSTVLAVVAGPNKYYLNGASSCAAALWGPINFTALAVNSNSPATLTAP
jgi:hypothetical protein